MEPIYANIVVLQVGLCRSTWRKCDLTAWYEDGENEKSRIPKVKWIFFAPWDKAEPVCVSYVTQGHLWSTGPQWTTDCVEHGGLYQKSEWSQWSTLLFSDWGCLCFNICSFLFFLFFFCDSLFIDFFSNSDNTQNTEDFINRKNKTKHNYKKNE